VWLRASIEAKHAGSAANQLMQYWAVLLGLGLLFSAGFVIVLLITE